MLSFEGEFQQLTVGNPTRVVTWYELFVCLSPVDSVDQKWDVVFKAISKMLLTGRRGLDHIVTGIYCVLD